MKNDKSALLTTAHLTGLAAGLSADASALAQALGTASLGPLVAGKVAVELAGLRGKLDKLTAAVRGAVSPEEDDE